MFTYPEALNAMQKLAKDYFRKALPGKDVTVSVVPDAIGGTASVSWTGRPTDADMAVTINMPVRPATYRMGAGEFDHWAAYMLHEVGHPLHTEQFVWYEAVKARQHRLLNALEDVREEKATIDMGLALNAKKAFSALVDSLGAKAESDGFDPNEFGSIGWTMSSLGRKANGYDMDVGYITRKLDPNGVVAKMLEWAMPELAACKSTVDAFELTKKISAHLGANRRHDPRNKKPGQPGLPGESKAMGSGFGSGPLTNADVDDTSLKPNSKDDMVHGPEANVQASLTEALRREAKDSAKKKAMTMASSNDHAWVRENAARMGLQRALLARALKRNEQDSYEGNRAHGRLDRKVLSKAATGNPNIFGKRTLVEGYDTDVHVLVDGSGSMSGTKMLASAILALVIAQAAKQVGVDCTVDVFTDHGLHRATKGKDKPEARRFAGMPGCVTGGTPLTRNLIRVAHEQAGRARGKRKVLFTITDGGCNLGTKAVEAAGQYIESEMGIEIANLHIGSEVLGQFRNEVAVDINNVSGVGLRKLTQVLEKGR